MSDDNTYAIASSCSNKKTATTATIASTYNGLPVTTIEKFAFKNCRSLTSINIPNSVTTIGDSAFQNCSSLTSINIPESVTTIDAYAFSDCAALEYINIPDSVTDIGENALKSPNLKWITTGQDIHLGDYGSPADNTLLYLGVAYSVFMPIFLITIMLL